MASGRAGCWLLWLAIATGLGANGCEGSRRGPAELGIPDLQASRAALTTALDAWKADRRGSGIIIGANPAIGIVDAARADRRLRDYRIVGPLMPVGKARPFAVRLELGGPDEMVTTRYLVMGQDPLWVFRQEDFERMIHWEHKMDDQTETQSEAGPSPGGR